MDTYFIAKAIVFLILYKATDDSWHSPPGNKTDFYSFYYYFHADPPEHHTEVD